MRRPAVVVLLAVAAALGGAGCSSSSNEPPPPAAVSLDEFPAAFAQGYCRRVFSCCRPQDRSLASPGDDEASCTAQMTENVRDNAQSLLDGGGLGYFEDAAQRCLQLFAYGPCGALFEPGYGSLVACQDVFAATGALGDLCEDPRQCTSGACVGGVCVEGGTCPAGQVPDRDNECYPRAALGGVCINKVQCPSGTACGGGMCVMRRPIGSPCAQPEECTGTCAPNTEGASTCRVGYCSGE
jgi:hypothetical protein